MAVFILDKVSKTFKNDKNKNDVLKDVSISFPDCGLVSIVGKSGSGKSTLLNILMGIEKPTKGKILFLKHDISKFNDKEFSDYHLNQVSLIFQHYNLFNDLTSYENAILPLKMRNENTKEIKEKTLALFKKLNVEKLLTRKVNKLSGGEKQRIAIIRALLIEPKAILCDEPTGALDSENSREIMGILKKISEKTLVIMVSHNKELVDKYSDKIFVLKNGTIEENTSNLEERFTKNYHNKKYKYSSNWTKRFLIHNLTKNFKKNIFSIFASICCFVSMYISVGFLIGSRTSQNNALLRSLEVCYSTVSQVTNIELENSPLTYTKQVTPELYKVDELFKDFKSLRCEENLSYFISSYPTCFFNQKTITEFSMIPLYDISLEMYGKDFLIDGTGGNNSFNQIIINTEFSKRYSIKVNDEIILSNSASIKYSTGNQENPFVKDDFTLNDTFKVAGIVSEFSFLNSPKIYFSYFGAKQILANARMDNLSQYKNESYSFYDYLCECSPDDPVGSYSSVIFITDKSEIQSFYEIISKENNLGIEVSSNSYEVSKAYSGFINSFSAALIIFVVIAFIGINLILSMLSLSSFLENKKETAIMTCLGGRNYSLYTIYLTENFVLIFVGIIVSTLICPFFQKKLNVYLYKTFSLENLIQIPFKNMFGIPYCLPFLICSIAIIFSYVFTKIPMLIYRHKSITDELRDE